MSALRTKAFSESEIGSAILVAAIVEIAFFALLVWSGASTTKIARALEPKPEVVPIAVQPVLDDLPLLKLGSKKNVKQKLPDMWKKNAPVPVKRYEDRSAPSEDAEDDLDEIPDNELADKDHPAPPESAELTKEAPPVLSAAPSEEAPAMNTEGAADGSKDGTETDPLKARQVDLYRVKIASWFNSRFEPPVGQIPCDELKKLKAKVTVQVGGEREITSFSAASSGNAVFDARVQKTIQALVGQELPPPPQLYPDILGSAVFPVLSGVSAPCKTESSSPSPTPTDPSPAPENP